MVAKTSEWLSELERLQSRAKSSDSSYRTTKELASDWGCSHDKVTQLLHLAKDAGLLEGPIQVERVRLDGRKTTAPAYRIAKKGKVVK